MALPGLLALSHCAAGASDDEGSAPSGGSGGAPGPCIGPGCGASTGGSSAGGTGGAPPEQEIESSFRSPVATGKYVWTANPDSGRVALIDALSLEVKTVEAGNGPTHLAALVDPKNPDAARAIVLNVKSRDATVFVADPSGTVTTHEVDVHEHANTWAIGATGRFAIAWTDAAQVTNPDPTDGFQDVTVIDLAPTQPVSTRLSVGYRPTRVFVAADESRAFVVTEPGISVIELADPNGPLVSVDVPVTDDPLENPASRDVSVTPDGKLALVRRDGSADVGIVSLTDGTRVSVTLSGPVTDLDLSPDGTRAVAVVREPFGTTPPGDAGSDGAAGAAGSAGAAGAAGAAGSAGAAGGGGAAGSAGSAGATGDASVDAGPPPSTEVALLPIPGIFSAPTQFDSVTLDGENVGSVSLADNGSYALLYTNAIPNDHLVIVATSPGASYLSRRTVALKAPIKAVFPTPDGAHAIALLQPAAGSSKAGAFSLVPVAAELPPKILGTDAPPVGVAIQAAPTSRALVTVRDDVKKSFATHLVRMPQLQVDTFKLASPPLATGIAQAAGTGYVAQEHPEGRITFINLAEAKARTLTGFELGAKVVDGSQ